MTHLREHWEGVSLSGDYTLERWLGGDDSAAYFQTSLASGGRRAVVKLVPEAVLDGATPLGLWHRTRQLRHPNLIELLDCGRAGHRGEVVLYALFESPDDTLAAALSRSPLNRQESREVLDSVIEALRYLHAQGLALGALDPDHVVAVGDRIKLSTGALRAADTASACREDIRLLGDLWRQALMPASAKSSEIAAHAADPDPQARWTLAEISAALDAPLPTAPPPAPPHSASSPISVPLISVSPVSVPPVAVRDDAPALPPSRLRTPERAMDYRFPKWIFLAAASAPFPPLAMPPLPSPPPACAPPNVRWTTASRNGFSWPPPESYCSSSLSIGRAPSASPRHPELHPSRSVPQLPCPRPHRRPRCRYPSPSRPPARKCGGSSPSPIALATPPPGKCNSSISIIPA